MADCCLQVSLGQKKRQILITTQVLNRSKARGESANLPREAECACVWGVCVCVQAHACIVLTLGYLQRRGSVEIVRKVVVKGYIANLFCSYLHTKHTIFYLDYMFA